MTLKVAYIVSRFPHLPETFILREMNELQAQGHTVELFPLVVQKQALVHPEAERWLAALHHTNIFSWKCLWANLRTLILQPGRYIGTFFQMIWFNLSSLKFLLRALFIFPLAVQMAAEMRVLALDHVHAHYATHPALAAWIIARLTGLPYSISVHAHDIFVNRTMLQQKLDDAVFIRTISQFNKNYLVEHCGVGIERKTHVIHCGIQVDRYRRAEKKSSQDYYILNVGSLQPYKGQRFLVDACKYLREQDIPFHCRIVGGGELCSELEGQINVLGLEMSVELLGPKTEEEVTQLLAEADCFVLPSVITPSGKMEGIPVVLMEALASELPVIASAISGIPELVHDRENGFLVVAGDALAIAMQVAWLRDHPLEAVKMAAAGRQLVLEQYDLQKNTLELANLFIQFQNKKK
jgi:colanic acid/amylovoran biosynthesis glycosyltransferase